MMQYRSTVLCLVIMLFVLAKAGGQEFYVGVDLSYLNEMQDCGASYTVEGEFHEPYSLFKERGADLVRLRLWHTPSWYDNLNFGNRYSDFADVRYQLALIKFNGMEGLLDFHLSDNWADPAHQVAPAAWSNVLNDLPVLQDSLYNYVFSTLMKLADEDLLPAIVQIGNETNKGILQSQAQNDAGWWLDWPRNAALFNTAIDALRDVEAATGDSIKIALHIANPADITWFIAQFWMHGVQDFDIIGLSYYASYHPVSIAFTGDVIHDLVSAYPGKEVMILETAYPWTTAGEDNANNVLNGVSGYPPSPGNQKQWMIDLTQTMIDNGGSGVVYWEPAWVSTPCSTQWAEGSHWENATFFDFNNNLHADGGMDWMSYAYEFPTAVEETGKRNDLFTIDSDGKNLYVTQKEVLNERSPIVIELFAMDGRMVWSGAFQTEGDSGIMIIDQPVTSGMYLVKIRGEQTVYQIEKIVFVQ